MKKSDPAFPRPAGWNGPVDALEDRHSNDEQDGMSYRQWLAGHCLAALAGGVYAGKHSELTDPDYLASEAVLLADALIKALEE